MDLYWDLDEKERAALSRDDVALYLNAELMTKGVLRVAPLTLLEVPSVDLPKRIVYCLMRSEHSATGIAFENADDAAAVAAMHPMAIDNEWQLDRVEYTTEIAASVVAKQVATSEAVANAKSKLKEAAAAKSENEKRKEAHEKARKAEERALEGLWEDWHACRAKAESYKRIADTFVEYVKMAGDPVVASKFLRKVFPESQIQEAVEWCGLAVSPRESSDDIVVHDVVNGASDAEVAF